MDEEIVKEPALTDNGELINSLVNYINNDEEESAKELLSRFDAEALKKLFFELPSANRVDALALLPNDVAIEVIKCADDDISTYFLHGLPSLMISEAVEKVFSGGNNESINLLPSFAVQKILTHGTPAARRIIADSIANLVETKQLATLREVLIELNPVDIAGILDDFKDQDLLKLFRLMPKDMASDVFIYLPQEISEQLISLLSDKEAGQIIDDLYADDAADFLEEMPSKVVKKLLAQAKPETRADINHLLQYKEDSAGSIMTVEFVDLKEDYTVSQAIDRIRRDGIDKETVNNCFVLDARRKLLGIVSLRKLLLSKPSMKVGDLMEENLIVARTNTDQEEVARLFKKYGFLSIPVCDSENRLVGIITVDDIVDIIQEEALDDASLISKVTPSDTEYLKTSVWSIWLNRVPWLMVLMVSATFTGLIISQFEHILLGVSIALFAYIPMLMDTGGNAGSQASVTIICGMALGEIEWKDYWRVIWKEMRASVLLGLSMALACFIKVIALDQFIYGADSFVITSLADGSVLLDGFAGAAMVGAIISATLFITVIIAKFVGANLPIIAKKIKLDPAIVASPFITTIVDAVALLIYCGIALLFVG